MVMGFHTLHKVGDSHEPKDAIGMMKGQAKRHNAKPYTEL